MCQRIAFFATKENVEQFFQFETGKEVIFEPHYNVAPSQSIPVIYRRDDENRIGRVRWGLDENVEQSGSHLIRVDEAAKGLDSKRFQRCIIPVSGYYKWKESGKRKDHPFFIRMLNEPVMALAGVTETEKAGGKGSPKRCALIQTESNALVQPLDPLMPLQFDRQLSADWLEAEKEADVVIAEANKLFLLTEMTVLRVGKKVNDLTENSPDLIQPLPK